MFRSIKSCLFAAAGLLLLAGCTQPQSMAPVADSTDGPQLAGAWYQVYFDNDSSQINSRGQMIIQTVANVVKSDDKVRVTIIGKTDRVGGVAENTLLSKQRADTVRDSLIAHSVPSDRIATSWVGEGKQDVVTANNVAEQRNRVVDIAVQHPY